MIAIIVLFFSHLGFGVLGAAIISVFYKERIYILEKKIDLDFKYMDRYRNQIKELKEDSEDWLRDLRFAENKIAALESENKLKSQVIEDLESENERLRIRSVTHD